MRLSCHWQSRRLELSNGSTAKLAPFGVRLPLPPTIAAMASGDWLVEDADLSLSPSRRVRMADPVAAVSVQRTGVAAHSYHHRETAYVHHKYVHGPSAYDNPAASNAWTLSTRKMKTRYVYCWPG